MLIPSAFSSTLLDVTGATSYLAVHGTGRREDDLPTQARGLGVLRARAASRRRALSFDLVRALGDADGLVTSEGTLYPLLGRLRREGMVDTTWRESSSGPPRRYYQITSDGDAALNAFATQWARFRASVDSLLEQGAAA